jgi:hypothetical protein
MNKKKLYIWLGILIVLLVFFLLELINPYLFMENDNFSYFAPNMIEGMDQLFSGQIPSINMHQLMGTKILENGLFAVFYPFTIISYFFAHFLFGNDFLIFEIFALLHFVLGFILFFTFINSKTKNNLICFLASLAFTFSGYFQLTKAWCYVAPLLIFLPLIFLLNDKLNKKGLKIPILLGLVRGIFFYSGNVQNFAYLVIFELLYFLIKHYQKNWKEFKQEFKKYIFSWVITIIMVVPLLWAQLKTSQVSSRGNLSPLEYLLSRPTFPTDSFFGTLIFPSLLSFSSVLFRYNFVHYFGTLFALLFFGGGIILIAKYKKKSLKKISPFLWCGLIAMVLSWGIFGLIYSFGLLIPFVSSFQGPYKIIPFVNFFMISFGAIIFNRIINKNQFKKYLKIITILFLILLFSNIFIMATNQTHVFHKNKIINDSLFKDLDLQDQRFVTILTNTSYAPKLSSNIQLKHEFSETDLLTKNFASFYGIDHLGGYETFRDKLTKEKIPFPASGISNKHVNLSTMYEYGVKYFIVPNNSFEFHTELHGLKKIYENENFMVLEQQDKSKVRPYVFTKNRNLIINYSKNYNGFDFKTSFIKPENVTINLLHKDNYIAKINKKEVQYYKDDFGRIFLEVPEGNNEVRVYYSPKDFIFGIYIAIFFLIILIILFYFRKALSKKYHEINFNKFFTFIGKNKWKFLILILGFLAIFFLNALSSPINMEDMIESKFGIQTDIHKMKIKPLKGIIEFSEIKMSKNNNKIFSLDSALFEINYKQSIKNTLSNKKPQLLFSKVTLSKININAKINNKQELTTNCNYYLDVSYPPSFEILKEFNISSDELILENVIFVPINSLYFSFEDQNFNLTKGFSNLDLKISSEINLERYLYGKLDVNSNYEVSLEKQKCMIFPIENKNNVIY